MKRVLGLLGVLALLFALVSCAEAGGPITAKMLEGTWEFDEGYEIFFLDEFENVIDADFDWPGYPDKRAYLHVTFENDTLTGTYDYEYTSEEGDPMTDRDQSITITVTWKNETLSLRFSGEGVLNTLHLTGGKKVDYIM